MKTLLLLTCGTNACYHIAKTLKEKFSDKFKIIGADINQRWMIPTSCYLDNFYQSPCIDDVNYYQFVLDVCKIENVDYILPSFDSDQMLFYLENDDLKRMGVKSFGISQQLKEIYKSKYNTNKFLESIGLPVPHMYSIVDVKENEDYFVKPMNGVGSVGAHLAKGKDLLSNYNSNYIIQELCNGPEVTLECFLYQGKIYSVARQRLACKSGVCTKARIYKDENLTEIAQRMANCMPLPYIFNLQFMVNNKGQFVITDVNLRSAGGMSLSYVGGWDEISALAKIMLNEADVLSSVDVDIPEQYAMRAYTDIITKRIGMKIGFDLDGTLLDSRSRHEILMSDLLKSRSLKIDTSDLLSFKSQGLNNLAWLKFKNVPLDLADEINNEWIDKIENKEYLQYDILYPYTLQMLSRLSLNNSLYLVTARCDKKGLLNQLNELCIKQYFEDICIVPSGKESSMLKAEYIKKNKIDVFVGDTEADMKAAEIADCRFEACMNGFRSTDFWNNYDVKEFIENDF